MVKKIKFIGVLYVHVTLHKSWVSHDFSFLLMAVNTSICIVVRGGVMSSRNVSRSQMNPFMFLLDALRLLGDNT